MTWTMDRDGVMLTASEAREWLHEVIADRDLVGQYWDHFARLDKGLKLPVPLTWAACLAHRDGLMAEPDIWQSLNNGLRLQMVLLDEHEIGPLVAEIVNSAVAHYGEPTPDDDDGWWITANGRPLSKDEAEQAIIRLVITGERQDILDQLADWDDDFKVMLAACPLESDPATMELVRSVVKDVVAKEYYEGAGR